MLMNRIIQIAIVFSLMLVTACTKHQIVPAPQVPDSSRSYIFFKPEICNIELTKAILYDGDLPSAAGDNLGNGTAFGVMGYCNSTELFWGDNIAIVYRESDKGTVFKYDNLAVWQDATSIHDFYAYFPYKGVTHTVTNTEKYVNYALPNSSSAMIDILTAKNAVTKKSCSSVVPLQFSHRLWALDLIVVNNQNENPYKPGGETKDPNLYVTDAKISLIGIPTEGKIHLNKSNTDRDNVTPTTFSTSDAPWSVDLTNTTTTIASNKSMNIGEPLLFLPTGNLQYKIDLTLENAWNVEYTFSTEFKYFTTTKDGQKVNNTFEAGKRYQLVVTKTAESGFDVSLAVQGWDDSMEDIDHTFN